ncbi:MAG: ABC transporter permease [Planctomycetes bacterium]|nr:ABC transporter permease [Planctomycetota bacterium]
MLWQMIAIAFGAIRRRLLRSALVVITVGIGIAAVLTTVALTDGLKKHVQRNTSKAGRGVSILHNGFDDQPTGTGGPDLPENGRAASPKPSRRDHRLCWRDMADLAAAFPVMADAGGSEGRPVRFLPTVIDAATAGEGEAAIRHQTYVVFTVPDYQHTVTYGVAAGRFLTPDDLSDARPVCVLDGGMAREIWGAKVNFAWCLGRTVEVGGTSAARSAGSRLRLLVVGVMEEPFVLREQFKSMDSSRFGRGAIFSRLNLCNVYAPFPLAVPALAPGEESVALAGVRAPPDGPADGLVLWYGDDAPDVAMDAYEKRLNGWTKARGLKTFLLPQRFWLDKVGDTVANADVVGGVIWVVILLVAVVMITVINLVVVRERYREVAIRRTEGARRSDVVLQFMVESVLLALAGGALGIAGGVVGAHLLSDWVTHWLPAFTPRNFVLAVLLAILIGVLSTVLPAFRAGSLDPVKVLTRR